MLGLAARKLHMIITHYYKAKCIFCAIFWFIIMHSMPDVDDMNMHIHQIHLHHVTLDLVKQHQNMIDGMMYRHRYAKAVILSGVTAVTCIYAFNWLKEQFKENNSLPMQMATSTALNETMQPPSDSYCMFWLTDFMTHIKNIFSFKGMQSIVGNFIYLSARYATACYIMRYAFHPDTLSWYVSNCVPYKQTEALIREYALLLKACLQTPSDSHMYYKQTLQILMQKMLIHVAQISGYLQYQALVESQQIQQEYASIVNFLLKEAHEWANQMMILAYDLPEDYDICIQKTQEFTQTISREIKHAQVICIADILD